MFSSGDAPDKSTSEKFLREEMGGILFENEKGVKGPKSIRVCLPYCKDQQRIKFKPKQSNESLLDRMKSKDNEQLFVLKNKQPQYDQKSGAYMLNFNGRVQKASIKNFQM